MIAIRCILLLMSVTVLCALPAVLSAAEAADERGEAEQQDETGTEEQAGEQELDAAGDAAGDEDGGLAARADSLQAARDLLGEAKRDAESSVRRRVARVIRAIDKLASASERVHAVLNSDRGAKMSSEQLAAALEQFDDASVQQFRLIDRQREDLDDELSALCLRGKDHLRSEVDGALVALREARDMAKADEEAAAQQQEDHISDQAGGGGDGDIPTPGGGFGQGN